MEQDVIHAILRNIRPECDFSRSTNLLSDGILDSYDVITLISELQDSFKIEIDPMELVPENFETVTAIWQMALRYTNKKG